MKRISSLDELIDAVMEVSRERENWDVKEFMHCLESRIRSAIINKQQVSSETTVAYFQIYALLGQKASRERIRATALGVKGWLRHV